MGHSLFNTDQTKGYKADALKNILKESSLFAELGNKELDSAVDACVTKRLKKGETLFREGSSSVGFYIVQSGAICLSRLSAEGKEQVISVFKPLTSFAEASLTTLDTYPANAVALEPSQVILVRKDKFRELIKAQPDLALSMLGSMSIHLKHLVQIIDDLKFKQIECRLANWLARNAPESVADTPSIIELPMSKKLLASQLGVTSETLSRAFARFRNEDIIAVDGRRITIKDADALANYLDV
jgi:CRP/FNR family transcriptional regulator